MTTVDRRGFIQAVLAGLAALGAAPARAQGMVVPTPAPSKMIGTLHGAGSCIYEYIRADRDLVCGTAILDARGRIVGHAIGRVAKGHYAFVLRCGSVSGA